MVFVDAFLAVFASELELLHVGAQVWVRKTSRSDVLAYYDEQPDGRLFVEYVEDAGAAAAIATRGGAAAP